MAIVRYAGCRMECSQFAVSALPISSNAICISFLVWRSPTCLLCLLLYDAIHSMRFFFILDGNSIYIGSSLTRTRTGDSIHIITDSERKFLLQHGHGKHDRYASTAESSSSLNVWPILQSIFAKYSAKHPVWNLWRQCRLLARTRLSPSSQASMHIIHCSSVHSSFSFEQLGLSLRSSSSTAVAYFFDTEMKTQGYVGQTTANTYT